MISLTALHPEIFFLFAFCLPIVGIVPSSYKPVGTCYYLGPSLLQEWWQLERVPDDEALSFLHVYY
jgi:hypothetical protein